MKSTLNEPQHQGAIMWPLLSWLQLLILLDCVWTLHTATCNNSYHVQRAIIRYLPPDKDILTLYQYREKKRRNMNEAVYAVNSLDWESRRRSYHRVEATFPFHGSNNESNHLYQLPYCQCNRLINLIFCYTLNFHAHFIMEICSKSFQECTYKMRNLTRIMKLDTTM